MIYTMRKNKTWKENRECWPRKFTCLNRVVRKDLSKKVNHLNKELMKWEAAASATEGRELTGKEETQAKVLRW